jgi:hypothetical protein
MTVVVKVKNFSWALMPVVLCCYEKSDEEGITVIHISV